MTTPSTTLLATRLPEPPSAARILVVRLGAIGDVVRTRVAFAGLRDLYPEATIDWLVEDRAADALDGIVGLDGIVSVPRRRLSALQGARSLGLLASLARELRARRYDLAVDFHGILKSGLLVRASGTPNRVGYDRGFAREGSHHFYNHRVRIRPTHLSRFERNAALVSYLGGSIPDQPPPLRLAPDAERDLEATSIPVEPVVMHPGTSEATRYKRWLAERFGQVAQRLHEEHGWPTVVTWGPVGGERECAQEVVSAARGAATLGPPTRSVAHLLALLARARLFIGCDSGPMHLAALACRPLVVLYGATDPVENAPFSGVPSRVLRHDVGCNPCREGCPVRVCMDAIGVEEVVAAATEVVAATPAVQ
jgi:3-deoxy-D-manno-octulosonic-acid transferase/heptosyltransferase-1